ncbi:MAG: hypothetical protein MZV49_10615 [Rhodopseudomonas palustris]|nr:hypothetical protein [Rhodopseudomonas palustris]
MSLTAAAMAVLSTSAAAPALAQDGRGPVGTIRAKDIDSYRRGLAHGSGEVRACLERNRDKVSPDCKTALDTTGGEPDGADQSLS